MTIERNISIRAWEHPLEALPSDLLGIMTPAEQHAYSEGASHFKKLAASSGCSELAELLSHANDDQPMFVDMKKYCDSPWYVWFGFTLVSKEFHPRMRLSPKTELPNNAPERLKNLYSAFGGICESSFIGGFMTPERINLGANEYIMDHHNLSLPSSSFAWFDFRNGDFAGWLDSGRGFMYEHELGEVNESEFDDLYDMLLSSLNRDPYEDLLD